MQWLVLNTVNPSFMSCKWIDCSAKECGSITVILKYGPSVGWLQSSLCIVNQVSLHWLVFSPPQLCFNGANFLCFPISLVRNTVL